MNIYDWTPIKDITTIPGPDADRQSLKTIQNKWDIRFLDLAKHVSTWSKGPSTGIGAVITNNKNRIISIGFNGYPRNVPDEGMDDREEKYLKVIHAEENALLFAQRSLCGCTIYVYPLLPCSNCMAKIIQVGITKVVVLVHDTNGIIERWEKSNKIALNMAECANVNVSTYLLP